MSPNAGELIVHTIAPIIRRTIARGMIRPVGAEDIEELTADCIAQAARILHAGEAHGKELPAATVVYFALQHTRYGERCSGKSYTDVMAPRTQFKKRSILISLDAPCRDTSSETGEDFGTLHDTLAAPAEDVACRAARRIDWDDVTDDMSRLDIDILCSMADGRTAKAVSATHDLTTEQIKTRKHDIKTIVRSAWDPSIAVEASRQPAWKRDLHVLRERRESMCARAMA